MLIQHMHVRMFRLPREDLRVAILSMKSPVLEHRRIIYIISIVCLATGEKSKLVMLSNYVQNKSCHWIWHTGILAGQFDYVDIHVCIVTS